jgi:uncharacterized protein
MQSWLDEAEALVYSGRIKVPYRWWVGETGSRFFVALRDEMKILGTYCEKCKLVFVPPRKTCGRCFHPQMAWREVGRQGSLTTWTVPRYREDMHPLEPPFAFGVVKLDGADTGLTHLVGEFREGELRSGIRVEAVFREKREGNILDIRYFRPVRG